VCLEIDTTERDKYGRLLAYIWLEQPIEINDKEIRNKMFNAILLLNGYAQILTIPPNVRYVDNFTIYQNEARESNIGLWGISNSNTTNSNTTKIITETKIQEENVTIVFVGSINSDKYHYPNCVSDKRIKPSNLIQFNSSQDARNAGYSPCQKCTPP
jgi:micrococcal nuclease